MKEVEKKANDPWGKTKKERNFTIKKKNFRPDLKFVSSRSCDLSIARAQNEAGKNCFFFKKISPPPSCLFIFLFLFDHVVSPIIFPFWN
jgi:hypothetical protein